MKKLIVILLLLIAFTGCSKRTLDVGTGSMEPTIPAGSKVVVDFSAYVESEPVRFDIVVFRPPQTHPPFPPRTILCHRIVGLPLEKIELVSDAVLINENKLDLPKGITYQPAQSDSLPSTSMVTLMENEYFMLGDKTANARDSRYFGPVSRANILGKVIRIEPVK